MESTHNIGQVRITCIEGYKKMVMAKKQLAREWFMEEQQNLL